MGRLSVWKIAGVIVVGACLSWAVAVSAQGPQGRQGRMPPGGPGGPGGIPPGLMRVNLTDQQKADLKTLVDQDREARKASMDELRTARQQLTAAIFGTDTQQVPTVTAHVADLQRQAFEADVALQVKIAALLTDEQKQQILTARGPGE
jgi:periplasmic protein CpxP/Spy